MSTSRTLRLINHLPLTLIWKRIHFSCISTPTLHSYDSQTQQLPLENTNYLNNLTRYKKNKKNNFWNQHPKITQMFVRLLSITENLSFVDLQSPIR